MEFSVSESSYGRFLLPRGDLISESIRQGRGWDADLLPLVAAARNPDGTAIDAGANVGFFSVQMAKHFREVLAFEPQRLIYYSLCANILLNGTTNVDAQNLALYCEKTPMIVARPSLQDVDVPHDGRTIDYERFQNYGGVAFESAGTGGTVSAITIDSLDLTDLAFIKTDCQGVDFLILKGGRETIARCRPVVLFESELKLEEGRGIDRSSYKAFFDSLGYRLLTARGTELGKQTDFLAFPAERNPEFGRFARP